MLPGKFNTTKERLRHGPRWPRHQPQSAEAASPSGGTRPADCCTSDGNTKQHIPIDGGSPKEVNASVTHHYSIITITRDSTLSIDCLLRWRQVKIGVSYWVSRHDRISPLSYKSSSSTFAPPTSSPGFSCAQVLR